MSALEEAIERPEAVRSFAARSPLHGLDRHTVGFADVLAQSVAAIAPAAASAMAVLMVADLAGGATVLVMALATIITFLVARTINQFTRRFAASGSLYTYAARGLGTTAGLATGAAIVVGYAFISVFALLGGAHYATMLLTRLWPQLPATPIALGALVVEAAVLAIVLVRGIRLSSRVALVVELVSVALILLLLIVLLVQIGPIHPAAVFSPDDVSVAGVAGGAVLAITAFVGFESSATLGVEARSPLKNIPRAIMWSVGVAGVFYLIAAYTQIAGAAAIGGTTSVALLDELASRFGLSAWAAVADVGIATSGLACAIASTTALTRIVFALARDGVAPAELGRTHPPPPHSDRRDRRRSPADRPGPDRGRRGRGVAVGRDASHPADLGLGLHRRVRAGLHRRAAVPASHWRGHRRIRDRGRQRGGGIDRMPDRLSRGGGHGGESGSLAHRRRRRHRGGTDPMATSRAPR